MDFEQRYSLVKDKDRSEEVVLLQGKGCFWKRCIFCDYYLDTDNLEKIIELNNRVLDRVTGEAGNITIINSGSYFELPESTRERILKILKEKNITDLSIESHWHYKDQVKRLKDELLKEGIKVHPRIGIESFDKSIREDYFKKGFGNFDVKEAKEIFDECCLLFGVKGQTIDTLIKDIEIALDNFKDVYLNIYTERNGLEQDQELIDSFINNYYDQYNKIDNLHILLNNTDLGVGD